MKSKLFILGIIIIASISSCKKDDKKTNNTPGSTVTTVLSIDSTTDGTNIWVKYFDYNSSKKLAKVSYKWGGGATVSEYDTIYYNVSGQISKVETYNVSTSALIGACIYNYTSGVLSSTVETGTNGNGAYERTRTFTYTSGKVSAINVVYTTGAGSGEPENFSNVVFTGNNITSADLTGFGNVTVTYETTATNPYFGLNYDPSDFINMFCQNNILKAYLTLLPTQIFVDNTYTYANGRVSTIVDASSSPARTTTLTYKNI